MKFHIRTNELTIALPLSINYYSPNKSEWANFHILNIVILFYRLCFIWEKKNARR